MTRRCSVSQCSNYRDDSMSLHTFPIDEDIFQKWVIALKFDKVVTANTFVCSAHFKSTDFVPVLPRTRKIRLRKGVVPSRNIPTWDPEENRPIKETYCCVPKCKPSVKNARHRFPDPREERGMFHLWLEMISNTRLFNVPENYVYESFRVCDRHFEESDYLESFKHMRKLKKSAVPKFCKTVVPINKVALTLDHNYCYIKRKKIGFLTASIRHDHTYSTDKPHQASTSITNIHSCKMCPYKTGFMPFLVHHKRRHQQGLRQFDCTSGCVDIYECLRCTFSNRSLMTLKEHMQNFHTEKAKLKRRTPIMRNIYSCRGCSFTSHSMLNWYKHVQSCCPIVFLIKYKTKKGVTCNKVYDLVKNNRLKVWKKMSDK